MSLYFLSRIARTLARRLAAATAAPERRFDPIDHPDIAAMDLRALADLPLAPRLPMAEAPRVGRSAARKIPHSVAA